jgi:tetratricopeptide (TPR) repeat protein
MPLNRIRIEVNGKITIANDFYKKGQYENAVFLYNKLLEIDKENSSLIATVYANRALCITYYNSRL